MHKLPHQLYFLLLFDFVFVYCRLETVIVFLFKKSIYNFTACICATSIYNISTDDIQYERCNCSKAQKYWKEQDPDLVKRVENGFKRLYG